MPAGRTAGTESGDWNRLHRQLNSNKLNHHKSTTEIEQPRKTCGIKPNELLEDRELIWVRNELGKATLRTDQMGAEKNETT